MKTRFLKSCGFLFTVCVLLPSPAFADRYLGFQGGPDPATVAEAARRAEALAAIAAQKGTQMQVDPEQERLEWERVINRRAIDKALRIQGPDAVRKYSDGAVASLKVLLEKCYGLVPKTDSSAVEACLEQMILIGRGYKVEEVTKEGCRIGPPDGESSDHANDIFVVGLQGNSGQQYTNILMVRHVGKWIYATSTGASCVIPKCELGERTTIGEYNDFFRRKKSSELKVGQGSLVGAGGNR
jgi:hypothetical protein